MRTNNGFNLHPTSSSIQGNLGDFPRVCGGEGRSDTTDHLNCRETPWTPESEHHRRTPSMMNRLAAFPCVASIQKKGIPEPSTGLLLGLIPGKCWDTARNKTDLASGSYQCPLEKEMLTNCTCAYSLQ